MSSMHHRLQNLVAELTCELLKLLPASIAMSSSGITCTTILLKVLGFDFVGFELKS
jgi:hypothetical protein